MKILPGWVILFASTFLFISSTAQESLKGNKIIHFSIGPNMANFSNAEAPHKIYIFGPDTAFADYDPDWDIDYQASLFKDILFGVTTGFSFEYFFTYIASISGGINYEMKGIDLDYSIIEGDKEKTFECKIKNSYLTVPLLLRLYAGKKKIFFMTLGMYSGFLLASDIHYYRELNFPEQEGAMKLWLDGKGEGLELVIELADN
jgi:hypothetical protein